MNIFVTIVIILGGLWFVASNIFVTMTMSAHQMHDEFIKGQCLVGKIFANIFYAPAWFLKGVRVVTVAFVK